MSNHTPIKTGIAHIGVGNFHRSHQAYYVHQYLQQAPDSGWGICGIALLENDRPIIDALKRQQGQYSLTTFNENGQAETGRIKSIVQL